MTESTGSTRPSVEYEPSLPNVDQPFECAWRIDGDHEDDMGVLLDVGYGWWLICPASATHYVSDEQDFEDCCDPTCEFIDSIHRRAGEFVATLRKGSQP